MRNALVPSLALLLAGCGLTNYATITSKSSVGRCIDRLLERSRAAGYTEVAADKEIAFFRVASKNGPDASRRNPGVFFTVQCEGDDRAVIRAVDDRGLFDDKRQLNQQLSDELDHYRRALDGY